jgi:hypothetical protein
MGKAFPSALARALGVLGGGLAVWVTPALAQTNHKHYEKPADADKPARPGSRTWVTTPFS